MNQPAPDDTDDDNDDPALSEPIGDFMERALRNPLPRGETRKETPHTRLKRACRKVLHEISGGAGCTIPIQNIRAQIPGTSRTYQTGRPGAADDIWVCRGTAFAIEYKAGHDRQSDRQKRFQESWEKAGGVYLVARDPAQLGTDIRAILNR